jgi:hypothetical protein
MSTTPAGESAYGVLTATRKSRLREFQPLLTIASTATTVGASATVEACTTAMVGVYALDRRPTTLPAGRRTGRVVRVENGGIATVGTPVAGTGYTPGAYTNVPLTVVARPWQQTSATANITVGAGGDVTVFTLVRPGENHIVGDVLTVRGGLIGPGTGFARTVASISAQ